jgi:hypothetical protein
MDTVVRAGAEHTAQLTKAFKQSGRMTRSLSAVVNTSGPHNASQRTREIPAMMAIAAERAYLSAKVCKSAM